MNKASHAVTGIRKDGYREILGASVAGNEDESFWDIFFEGLNGQGLKVFSLVVSDGHKG